MRQKVYIFIKTAPKKRKPYLRNKFLKVNKLIFQKVKDKCKFNMLSIPYKSVCLYVELKNKNLIYKEFLISKHLGSNKMN